MEKRIIKRGDIYRVNLNPVVGCEQGGYRPVLILQNNRGNQYSPTIIVAAITGSRKHKLPTHVKIQHMEGLGKESVVLLEQIRTIDRKRLENYVGNISPRIQGRIDRALALSLGINQT